MRPLSFENLRRLVGGRRKDRNEPTFKRSESFKRISIRKSYLDRGKRRGKLQKSLEPTTVAPPSDAAADPPKHTTHNQCISDKSVEQDKNRNEKIPEESSLNRKCVSYDEWLQEVSSISCEKLDDFDEDIEKVVVQVRVPPAPTTIAKAKTKTSKFTRPNPNLEEVIEFTTEGLKILEVESSPVLPANSLKSVASNESVKCDFEENFNGVKKGNGVKNVENLSTVSVNVGRVWREAAPSTHQTTTSSEPTSSSSVSVHRSLDSCLKERKAPERIVARTVSAPERNVNKDVTSTVTTASSSSHGFSLRIAWLADFGAGLLLFLIAKIIH